jgi:hypothetical protein
MLKHRNNFSKKSVLNIRHRNSNRVGLIGSQAGGIEIPAIAEFVCRDVYPQRQILSDGLTTIEDVGDGADRYTRKLRYVMDRRLL